MEIIIRENDSLPIYEQIVREVKKAIIKKEIMPGDMMPSIRALARELEISVITTKRAYEELEKEHADIEYYDPWVSKYVYHGKERESIPEISPEIIASYDLIMITAAHSNVDYEMIQKNAKAVFDTKNVMKKVANRENIEVL